MPPLPPDGKRPEGTRGRGAEVSSEDFLFHLYRGSELLQDNRVHEAKEELESALSLQPLDPKGQDLLAVVYFRLGMYPRAIEIFEQLVRAYPEERSPRINLALCYLKTGQASNARHLLEATLLVHPDNPRAWGYLGLVYERLGDYVKAREAFARGGHEGMAKRMEELAGAPRYEQAPPSSQVREPFQEIAADVVEVDRELPPAEAPRSPTRPPPSVRPPTARPATVPPPVSLGAFRAPTAAPVPRELSAVPSGESEVSGPLPSVEELARGALVGFPAAPRVTSHASGLLRVSFSSAFAVRPGAIRAIGGQQAGSVTSEPLARRARGKALDEPLGGLASPMVMLHGSARLLLGAFPGKKLLAFMLSDEVVFLREECLLGFEHGVHHENGRLAVGDGDAAAMVQLRGTGAVVLEAQEELLSLEVGVDENVAVRREQVLGWVGRLLPRALAPSEAPAGQRGLVMFSGEGMVLLDPRT